MKRFGETVVFAGAVLGLTYLAFVLVALFETSVLTNGLATDVRRLLIVAGALTGVFFASAVLIQFPLLRLANRARVSRGFSVGLGAVLGLAPIVLLAIVFRDREAPKAIHGYIDLYNLVPRQLLLDIAPYVLSGAALGWLAWKPRPTA